MAHWGEKREFNRQGRQERQENQKEGFTTEDAEDTEEKLKRICDSLLRVLCVLKRGAAERVVRLHF
jgi:hypothetical protein